MGNRQLFPAKSAKELLEAFKASGSQEPFEEIVRRYAAMVYGVCLRVTGDKHDAEDATQAVFLSLALQAKTSREIKYIGPWLQKVAHRLALDVKKAKSRRKKREEKLAVEARFNGNGHHNGNGRAFLGGNGNGNPADHPGSEELKKIMMEELDKLPAKYRMPLVLHYFGGLSREEMSAELGCNPSTLGVRVHRGKAMLGTRLAKRGVAMSAIALAVLLEHVVRTTTAQPLVNSSTIASSAVSLMASQSASVATVSAQVVALARTAAKAVVYAKLKVALIGVLAIGSLALTAGGAIATFAELKNLRLPVPMDLGKWVRPLLRGLVPNLQSNAAAPKADAQPEEQPSWDGPSIAMVPASPPQRPPTDVASSGSAAASAASSGDAPPPAEPPPLNALAHAILEPPVAVPPPTAKAEPKQDNAVGSQTKPQARQANPAEENDEDDGSKSKPILADVGGDLLLGAGGGGTLGGKPQMYILPENVTLRSNNVIVGDSGPALFRQQGGHNEVAGELSVGRKKGGQGRYELHDGFLSAKRETIGDEGSGIFLQYKGVNVAKDSIIVGKSGSGSYQQRGGETVVLNDKPTADPAQDPNGLHVGEEGGSTGEYVLADGTLSADPQLIGKGGQGTLTQSGGKNHTGAVVIGADRGSVGNYNLDKGKLVIEPRDEESTKPEAAIKIGGAGKGTFNFGGKNRTGAIYEVGGAKSSVVVRGQPSGNGSLIGYGPVSLTGVLVNNGQIVADGHRNERDLDLSSFTAVATSIENPRWGGANGWFARREGRLILPPVPVAQGNGIYTWGEDAGDPMIDLVNSVRFEIRGAKQAGNVRIALNSPLRDDLPQLPEGHRFIGVWSFDASELGEFTSADLEVRYDDSMAAALNLDEELLKLWQYDEERGWRRINDASFYRNTPDHIIAGGAGGAMSWFAVSAPEPGGAILLLAGAAALLRRRRRQ